MIRVRAAARAPVVLAALLPALLAAMSACGGVAGGAGPGMDDATGQATEQVAGPNADGRPRLTAAQVASLGAVLIDQDGRTLYRFDRDKATPSVSNCAGSCALIWPPVIVRDTAEVEVVSVRRDLVGTVQRPDGTTQLTLGGWPLYRYADDSKAGDANGQGVGGTWFASTPNGTKAQAPAPAPPPDNGGYGGGY